MTSSTSSSINWTVVIIGVLIVIGVIAWKGCSTSTVDLTTHDTVYQKVFVYDTVKGSTLDIPTLVTFYDTVLVHDTTIKLKHDSVGFIVEKHDTILQVIKPAFLTLYPASPKLILGDFYKDSLKLTLLGTDGNIIAKKYNLDYSTYDYEFKGDNLSFYPSQTKLQQLGSYFTTSAYFESYFNPIDKGAAFRGEFNIMYQKIGASTYMQLSTDQSPMFNMGVGVRIQIK